MIKSILILAAVVCLLSCCTVFQHPTKTQVDLDRERKECEQFIAENPDPNETCKRDVWCVTCEAVKRCLEEQKGWKRVRN
jgi:hypothetical protein